MPKQEEAKTYKCAVEGCNYQTTKEGYLTQHVAKAHKQTNKGTTTQKAEVQPRKCTDCGGSNLALLNPNNTQEKYWIQQGYTDVCQDCKEVIR